jgi:hypothetical protein
LSYLPHVPVAAPDAPGQASGRRGPQDASPKPSNPPTERTSIAICATLTTSPRSPRPQGLANTVFQSFFMLITTQPFCLASSMSAWEKVPTLVSGKPFAGP